MQHAIQYSLLAFIAGNAVWQAYTAALVNSTAAEGSLMWIFAKDGFLSIKQHNQQPRLLVVRGRVKGDIERLMSVRRVIEDTASDYRFRAFLDRDRVADRIAEHVRAINYGGKAGGFKSAVTDKRRAEYYLDVWSIMEEMQEEFKSLPVRA